MSISVAQARREFHESMARIAIGATLVAIPRNDRVRAKPRRWVVTKQRRYDTSMQLTLRCGKHEIRVNVGICHTGPCLMECGLRADSPTPRQQSLPGIKDA